MKRIVRLIQIWRLNRAVDSLAAKLLRSGVLS